MKKFILKLFLLIMPFIALNFWFLQTNYWKSKDDIFKFSSVPEEIELANVGSSHGECNFFYEDFPEYTSFNFGLSSQRHGYSYAFVKKYAKNFKKGAVVLVPISYFEITQVYDEEFKNELRKKYYRVLPRALMKEVDEWIFEDYCKYVLFPLFYTKRGAFRLISDFPSEKLNFFFDRTKPLEGEKLLLYCKEKHAEWTDKKSDKGEAGFKYNFESACRLVDFLKSKSLVVVFVTTPIVDILNDLCVKTDGFFNNPHLFVQKLQERYPDVQYFDYSNHPDFSPNHELFTDGDHLNVYGAKAFTARVIEDLKEHRILER